MGTDIHMVVQIRTAQGDWELSEAPGYDDRCYDVFAVLAGVRNGSGFAGIRTGGGFTPIADPRGFPAEFRMPVDLDYGNEEASAEGWLGDHSFSYLTLREILDYPHWEDDCAKCGVVNAEEFAHYEEHGKPRAYSGGVSGAGVIHISPEEMRRRVVDDDWSMDPEEFINATEEEFLSRNKSIAKMFGGAAPPLFTGMPQWWTEMKEKIRAGEKQPSFYTTVEWKEKVSDRCKHFLDYVRETLEPLGAPENVRIVFGFDS